LYARDDGWEVVSVIRTWRVSKLEELTTFIKEHAVRMKRTILDWSHDLVDEFVRKTGTRTSTRPALTPQAQE
jgi:hypothetical protein